MRCASVEKRPNYQKFRQIPRRWAIYGIKYSHISQRHPLNFVDFSSIAIIFSFMEKIQDPCASVIYSSRSLVSGISWFQIQVIKMIYSHCLGYARIQFGPMCTFGLFLAKNCLHKLTLRSSQNLSDHAITFPGLFSHGMPMFFE